MKLLIGITTLFIFTGMPHFESSQLINIQALIHTNNLSQKTSNQDFEGLWINEDTQPRGITKCEIAFKRNHFVVQMWGACTPEDCYIGKNSSNEITKNIDDFELCWDAGFAESTITYLIIDDKLKLINKRSYKDSSGRPNKTQIEYFTKQ